jgi:putative phage-type endonuclease
MKIYTDIIQGTPEWKAIRKGKMTGSHASEVGNCGKGLETYIYSVVAAELSSGEVDFYTNKHMERGTELEEAARSMYELETGNKVEQVGFVEYNEFVGSSPDGLVNEDTILEIKCHDDVGHLKMILNGIKEIDSKYIWQMQMNMLVTGRNTAIYVAYNPNFQKSLLTFTFYANAEKQAALLNGFAIGEAKIKDIKSKL